MNGLLEILTNKKWMMHPESLQAIRMVIQQNLAGHVALEQFEKRQAYCIGMTAEGEGIRMAMPSDRGEQQMEEEVQQFVAILPVCGPITRNGDACSYGSVDLRDAVMEVADDDECKGVVFYLNTPGGSASAIADYKYAINYLHERGKRCTAFVDGMCASAGMYLAALCDERYYMNEQDQIGSIGVMAAFYTEKDGEKNQYTNETYHELYATESYEKNKWHRDAADGNYDELIADLDKCCAEFVADVKAACPNATEEHLHGKMFDARDIDGILMDGQSTLDAIINNMIAVVTEGEPTDAGCKPKKCEDINNASNSLPTGEGRGEASNNTIHMNNYPLTQAALGCEELVVSEEGAFVNTPLLDNCESYLAEKDAAKAEAEQKLADAEKALADAQAHAKEIEEQLATAQTMAEEAQKALTEAKEAHAVETEAHNAALTKVTNEMAEQMKEMQGIKDALATAEQTLADKDAQIQALTAQPAEPQAQGEAPKSNGDAPEAPKFACNAPQYDPSLSPKENRRIMAEYRASLMK